MTFETMEEHIEYLRGKVSEQEALKQPTKELPRGLLEELVFFLEALSTGGFVGGYVDTAERLVHQLKALKG